MTMTTTTTITIARPKTIAVVAYNSIYNTDSIPIVTSIVIVFDYHQLSIIPIMVTGYYYHTIHPYMLIYLF